METFDDIFARAVIRHGSEDAVESRLPQPKSKRQLSATPDHRLLAEMTRGIFRAGFVWRVVEAKWPGFEEAFHGFDPQRVARISNRELEALARDARIIRNKTKIAAVRDNAEWMSSVAADHGSFARFLSAWPSDEVIGLWQLLKAEASRLGGDTGPMFLRGVGKDTFLLTRDVVGYLVDQGVVTKKPSGKGDLRATQEAFQNWQRQSGRPYCQISRTISLSWGDVFEQERFHSGQ